MVYHMLRNKKGQALLLVLILSTVIFLIGSAAVTLSTAVRRNAIRDIWQKKAYYIADAGVEMALADLRQRFIHPDPGFEELSIHNAPYADGVIDEVTINDIDTQNEIGSLMKITSKGRYREAYKTLEVGVLVTTMADVFNGLSILPETPADIDTDVVGNFTLLPAGQSKKPQMIVNGDLTFGSNADINAVVFASGEITDKHNRINSKDKYPNYSHIPPFPKLPSMNWFRDNATQCFSGGITIDEDSNGRRASQEQDDFLDITSLEANGIYIVEGDVSISGTYFVPATIVATGDISVEDLQRNDRDNGLLLTLIALGDVSVKGNSDIDAVIVACGSLCGSGNKELFGSIVTQKLDKNKISGKTEIRTDPDLVERSLKEFFQRVKDTSAIPDNPYPKVTIKSWQGG